MKKTVTYCDKCGKFIEDEKNAMDAYFELLRHRNADAAGSLDDVMESAELCHNCLKKFIYYFLKNKHEDMEFPGQTLKKYLGR